MKSMGVITGVMVGMLLVTGCGEEEPAVAPQERCRADGLAAYAEGRVHDDTKSFALDVSVDAINGSISKRELFLRLGRVKHPETGESTLLIARIFDAHSSSNLLDTIADLTETGSVSLPVVDATDIGAGSQGRTSLERFDCGFSKENLCVQVGLDSTGDELLLDDDNVVFNAASGTVTLIELDDRRHRLHVSWQLELGANILEFEDQSEGSFEGCINARYAPAASNQYSLQ